MPIPRRSDRSFTRQQPVWFLNTRNLVELAQRSRFLDSRYKDRSSRDCFPRLLIKYHLFFYLTLSSVLCEGRTTEAFVIIIAPDTKFYFTLWQPNEWTTEVRRFLYQSFYAVSNIAIGNRKDPMRPRVTHVREREKERCAGPRTQPN